MVTSEKTDSATAGPRAQAGGKDSEPRRQCEACSIKIAGEYFQVDERFVCPECRNTLVAEEREARPGSQVPGAFAWGGLAAVAGSALWVLITRVTGWEIGLVAIAVGWLVGSGVRKGVGGRGGRVPQFIAVVLTYLAIVATYVPDLHRGVMQELDDAAVVDNRGPESSPQTLTASVPVDSQASFSTAQGPRGESAPGAHAESAASEPMGDPRPALLGLAAYGLFLFGLASIVPFLDLPGNLIGLAILFFALHEAWRLNKRKELVVAGPFVAEPEESREEAHRAA
ncbi:MAG: hypothetical protein IPK67_03410 [Planctomycetes bacterium]|nr:hypothetical protein [Planctomycetota bacterium]